MITKLSELMSNAKSYSGVSDDAAIRRAFSALDESPVTQVLHPDSIAESEKNLTYGEHIVALVDELNSIVFYCQPERTMDKRSYIMRYFARSIELKRNLHVWQQFLRCNYLSFLRLMKGNRLVSEKKIADQTEIVFGNALKKPLSEFTIAEVLSFALRKATRYWEPENESIYDYQKSIRDAYYLIQIGVLYPMYQIHFQRLREECDNELPVTDSSTNYPPFHN